MPNDDPHPPEYRISLSRPGRRPRRRPSRRVILAVIVAALVAGLALAGFVWRRPIRDGLDAAAGGMATAGSAVWHAWSGWAASLQEAVEEPAEAPLTTTQPPGDPGESRLVLVTLGDGADTAAFMLLAAAPPRDPELVMIPQTLLVQVPGFGEFTMSEALAFGGPDLARLALANEMGVRLDDLVAIPPGGLAALGDDLVVDVPAELHVVEEDGSRRYITTGTQRLSMDLIELLLTEPGTGDQFDWLLRQESVWDGLLAAVAEKPEVGVVLAATADHPGTVAELVAVIAAEPVIGSPPVDRVAMGAGRDALVLATHRIDGYLAEHLSEFALRAGRRPRVEILNGNGIAGSGVAAAEVLVSRGFYVFRSANAASFDYAESQAIAQGEDAVEHTLEAAEALGIAVVLLEARGPSTVVDVSIIVGTDLAATEG